MPTTELDLHSLRNAVTDAHELQIGGRWKEAIDRLQPLAREGAVALIPAFLELGVSHRMTLEYGQAEQDFQTALSFARFTGDLDGQVEALVGLMDIARTGERDPNYGKRLNEAITYRSEAEHIVLRQMPPGWRVANINFYINSALLGWDFDENKASLKDITQAEVGCVEMLATDPQNRVLLNRRARAHHIKGVTLEKLDRLDEALQHQAKVYMEYEELDDLRGMGNAAMAAGRVCVRQHKSYAAGTWFKAAIKASIREEEILDRTIYDGAHAAIAALYTKYPDSP